MSNSVFIEKTTIPDEHLLSEMLGKSAGLWENIRSDLCRAHPEIRHEWKYYGKNYGWQLKTFLKKRNLFFLIPHEDWFAIVFVFGDRAVAEVEKSDLPADIIETLRGAKKYAEGRGISIRVDKEEMVGVVKKLIDIKILN